MNKLDRLFPHLKGKKIMLASKSPRRQELLSDLAIDYELAPPIEVDEYYPTDTPAEEVAPYLSRLKAKAYQPLIDDATIVITADTVVIIDDKILGKPSSQEEAKETLRLLSGKSHKVITGVTVSSKRKQATFAAETEVQFANLTDDEIDFYVETFNPLDKAGAYGIQEWIGCIGVKQINGSYYNVMGLPLHRLYDELKKF